LGCRFEGKAVVELGKVLGDNPDIAVLIEGHTVMMPLQLLVPIAGGIYQLKGRPLL
jgi:hypothetical protein